MAKCSFAMISKEDKILLVQIAPSFREAYKWNFPGGVVEENESLEEAVVREIKEETNLNCLVEKKIDSFSTTDPDNKINIFKAKYIDGQINVDLNEILDARWFSLEEVNQIELAFNIRQYIENYFVIN